MVKAANPDILAILRKFEIAGELTSRKSVRDVKEFRPRMLSALTRFIFEKHKYYILTDPNADDSEEYVLDQVKLDEPNIKGLLIRNPKDGLKTFGMPFKGKEVYLVQAISTKNRLDAELSKRYPNISRSSIQKYIKAGLVKVNGVEATKPRQDVSENDDIAMTPPVQENFSDVELPILYIDDDIIVVNKPAGVLTHSKGVMNQEFTVADFFRRYTTFGLETNRPGIVHRLDRDTSGVIIGARNEETALLLKKQFADRKTKKDYVAIVDGVPKALTAKVDLPIGRNPTTPSTFRVDASGKEAQTTYEVIASNGTQSLVKLTPRTGRTHQLRVHMQYINTPIAGDRIYGKKKADRLYLHAHKLELTVPVSRREIFIAPVPGSFTQHFPGAGDVE